MINQAVILAAGKGKRMKDGVKDSYLESTPKSLIDVNGVPLISRTVKSLISDGIQVFIVINKNEESKFRKALSNYDITYCYEDEPLGTAHALYSARDFITDKLFGVFMGDDIFDYEELQIKNKDAPTIFAYLHYDCINYGVLDVDGNQVARSIIEKKKLGKGLVNTGIYVMPNEFFELFKTITRSSDSAEYFLTDVISKFYFLSKGFKVEIINEWQGINYPKDLKTVMLKIEGNPIIRLARMSDVERLITLFSQLSESSIEVNYDKEKGKAELKRIVENPNQYTLVAVVEDYVVGTATLLVQNNLTHGASPYAHIENVVTDKEWRNKSIGKMLVNELIHIARQLSCYKVILNCNMYNSTFYEKLGFISTNEIEMRFNLNDDFNQ